MLHARQLLEAIGTGKNRAVCLKTPQAEKSRRDILPTARAIEDSRSLRAQ